MYHGIEYVLFTSPWCGTTTRIGDPGNRSSFTSIHAGKFCHANVQTHDPVIGSGVVHFSVVPTALQLTFSLGPLAPVHGALCWVAFRLGHSWKVSGASQQRCVVGRSLPSSKMVTLAHPREPTILSPSALARCTLNAAGPSRVMERNAGPPHADENRSAAFVAPPLGGWTCVAVRV